jgi:hypothetical protein
MLMWIGVRTTPGEARRATARALLLQDTMSCLASITFQLMGKVKFIGWFSLALYGILALACAFFLFV